MINKEIEQAMQSLFEKHNCELPASVVVKAAKNKRSPLHSRFEWDDTKAGQEYRLIQARQLIRTVKLKRPGSDKAERLVHVPKVHRDESNEGIYTLPSVIVENPTDFQFALREALARLNAAQRAIDELKAAAEDDDSLAKVTLAYEALSTANSALTALH